MGIYKRKMGFAKRSRRSGGRGSNRRSSRECRRVMFEAPHLLLNSRKFAGKATSPAGLTLVFNQSGHARRRCQNREIRTSHVPLRHVRDCKSITKDGYLLLDI